MLKIETQQVEKKVIEVLFVFKFRTADEFKLYQEKLKKKMQKQLNKQCMYKINALK